MLTLAGLLGGCEIPAELRLLPASPGVNVDRGLKDGLGVVGRLGLGRYVVGGGGGRSGWVGETGGGT